MYEPHTSGTRAEGHEQRAAHGGDGAPVRARRTGSGHACSKCVCARQELWNYHWICVLIDMVHVQRGEMNYDLNVRRPRHCPFACCSSRSMRRRVKLSLCAAALFMREWVFMCE